MLTEGRIIPGRSLGKLPLEPQMLPSLFFFLEVFLTTILMSLCFLGVFLFFLQNGYKNLGKETNKKQDQQSQTRVK